LSYTRRSLRCVPLGHPPVREPDSGTTGPGYYPLIPAATSGAVVEGGIISAYHAEPYKTARDLLYFLPIVKITVQNRANLTDPITILMMGRAIAGFCFGSHLSGTRVTARLGAM